MRSWQPWKHYVSIDFLCALVLIPFLSYFISQYCHHRMIYGIAYLHADLPSVDALQRGIVVSHMWVYDYMNMHSHGSVPMYLRGRMYPCAFYVRICVHRHACVRVIARVTIYRFTYTQARWCLNCTGMGCTDISHSLHIGQWTKFAFFVLSRW